MDWPRILVQLKPIWVVPTRTLMGRGRLAAKNAAKAPDLNGRICSATEAASSVQSPRSAAVRQLVNGWLANSAAWALDAADRDGPGPALRNQWKRQFEVCWDLGMERLSKTARAASWVLGLAGVGAAAAVILVKNNGGGAAAFLVAGLAFLLMAVTGLRITSLTLPGGSGISLAPQLTSEQRTAASEAVAREVRRRARQPVEQAAHVADIQALLQQQPSMLHLAIRAAAPQAAPPAQVQDDTGAVAQQAAAAAQQVTRDAEALLRLARTSPDALHAAAQAWQIPEAEWPRLMTGDISQGVWDVLARRAMG